MNYRAITRNYSTYTDHTTGVSFTSVLNNSEGVYVGLSPLLDESVADQFRSRSGFEVMSEEDWQTFSERPAIKAATAAIETGDPLLDAAIKIYTSEDLAGLKMPELRPIAARYDIKVIPGQKCVDVCRAILDAQDKAAANVEQSVNGAEDGQPALLAGAPKPPGSDASEVSGE